MLSVNTHEVSSNIPVFLLITTAPSVFQKTMDTMLQGLKVVCYVDDILVTGEDDNSHLQHVLERLQSAGLRLKRSKCSFLQSSIEYLGHRVDAVDSGKMASVDFLFH